MLGVVSSNGGRARSRYFTNGLLPCSIPAIAYWWVLLSSNRSTPFEPGRQTEVPLQRWTDGTTTRSILYQSSQCSSRLSTTSGLYIHVSLIKEFFGGRRLWCFKLSFIVVFFDRLCSCLCKLFLWAPVNIRPYEALLVSKSSTLLLLYLKNKNRRGIMFVVERESHRNRGALAIGCPTLSWKFIAVCAILSRSDC
jgi:hypothetical protein